MRRSLFAVATAAAITAGALAQTDTVAPTTAADSATAGKLAPGDKAPMPAIEHVVKGAVPKQFESGKVYVVEFWATWCGPCKASMPHLTKLQKEFKEKGVQIIGVSDEKLDTVTTFLDADGWAEKTQYTLATDPDRSTHKAYMEAAGQRGIPTAFIVGRSGHVEWIGHTMDEPLKKVVDGSWDRAAARDEFTKAQRFEEVRATAQRELMAAYQAGDWDTLMAKLDELIAVAPAAEREGIELQKFQLMLGPAERPDAAYALARELAAKSPDNAEMHNMLAWTITTAPGLQNRDLELAKKLADSAVKLTDGNDASILDTLAHVHWGMGEKARAIEIQKDAISKAEGQMKNQLEEVLELWEAEVATDG